jgi:hypothetical protein
LAIFPEDVYAPLATLEKYWGLDDLDTEDLCDRLIQFSLLHSYDLGARTIRLHDVIRAFLCDERKADLTALNNQLLDAHRPDAGWSEVPDNDHYLWDHLADHLIEAGRGEELVVTVKDRARRRSAADVAGGEYLTDLTAMLQDLAQNLGRPYVTPQSGLPDLPHPALIRTLEGHSAYVCGCAFSPDGQLIVSASHDRTLKVWDVATGQTLATFFADGWMCCCAVSGEMIAAGGVRGVYFLRLVR